MYKGKHGSNTLRLNFTSPRHISSSNFIAKGWSRDLPEGKAVAEGLQSARTSLAELKRRLPSAVNPQNSSSDPLRSLAANTFLADLSYITNAAQKDWLLHTKSDQLCRTLSV